MTAKRVKSDLKDQTPAQVDREAAARKPRHPAKGPEERSDHVTRAISQGENELRGGQERSERRGGEAVGPARGDPRH